MTPIFLLLQASASAPAPPPAPWAVVDRPTPTGPHSLSASATSAEGNARLVVRCDRVTVPVVSIQFIPTQRLPVGGVLPVALQFDGGTPLVANWERLGGGAIEREDGAATTLSSGIAHARQIRVHVVGDGAVAADATFVGPGGDAPVRRVVEACGQVLGQVPVRAPAPDPLPTPAAEDGQ